jgi:hypothetical protein
MYIVFIAVIEQIARYAGVSIEFIALRSYVSASFETVYDPVYLFPMFMVVHYLYWTVLMAASIVHDGLDAQEEFLLLATCDR